MKTTPNTMQTPRKLLKSLVLALTAGVLFMFHTPAVAAITLTDTGTQWAGGTINNASISNNFTVNASANVLVVSIGTRSQGVPLTAATVPVVTYNGITLTRAAEALGQNANYLSAMTYYMFDPPTGAALPLAVNFPGTNVITYAVDAYTLGGVDTSKQPELFPGWTASAIPPVNNLLTSSVTLNNLISGSWVADTAAFRNNGSPATSVFTAAVTSGTFGALNTSGPVTGTLTNTAGHQWAHRSADSIFGGALVENVTSSSVTVEHTVGAAGFAFNLAGVAFAPLVGTGYTISGTISTYDAADPIGALVELKVGGVVHARKTVPSGGAYSFTVPVGTYTIRASKSPYLPIESSAISITAANVTQDLTLPQDTIPLVWTSGYPQAADVGSTGFSARVNTDDIGTAYYVVVADGDPAPTSAQVEAGQNGSGGAAIQFGSISITAANTEFSAAVSGLAQNTSFDVYFVAKDAAGNLQASPVKRDITTLQNLYTENFNGGTPNQQLTASPVGWEGSYIIQTVNNSATPDLDSWYAAKWSTESGRMPVQTKVGEYVITAASRINTTFTVDFAAQQLGGMRFIAWVGGVRYGSDKFANVDATNGQFGSNSAVTTWATKSYSVESSNWYRMDSDIDELISTTAVPLPAGDITQFGVYWNNEGNGQQWAIDNFRVDATPATGTYAWDGGAGDLANSNWTIGGVPAQAPATGFHMFINNGGTVAVAADFLSALSVNVGQTGTAGSLTVNNTFALGATQLNLGSVGTLQVDGTLTAPAVLSNGAATISSTGVVNASSLVQIAAGSLTSAGGSQLNIGTGTLMLSGGTGATLDGQLNITGGTVSLFSGTLTYNHATNATPAVLVLKGGTLAGTGLVIPTVRYEVTNQTISGLTGGAGLVAESGTVTLSGSNPYTGTTEIRAVSATTYLRVADASLLSPGNLFFNGQGRFQQDARNRPATLETKGTLARDIGTGVGQIRFATATGEKSAFAFAAVGGPLEVTLNGGASINWGNTTTGFSNSWLEFGSPNSDDVVTLNNPITLTANDNTAWVRNNTSSPNDYAIIKGAISGGFNFARRGAGRLVLEGVNTYTGTTHVNNEDHQNTAMLEIGGAGQLGSGTYTAQIDIDSGTTFKYNSTADQVLSGNIIDSGALVKDNVGTLTLTSNASTNTGPVTVDGGKLLINGNSPGFNGLVTVNANGRLGGTGTVGGNVTIAATGGLAFDLTTPAISHDRLDLAAGKTLTFQGVSTLDITGGGTAEPGVYTLVTAPGGFGASVPPTTVNLPVGWVADPPQFVGPDLIINITSTGTITYAIWATANAGGQAANLDHNNDDVQNGVAYFMNLIGFGTNPVVNPVTKVITWPNGGNISDTAYGTDFVVQTSTDLTNPLAWTDVLISDPNLVNNASGVSYTLTGAGPLFVRLKVMTP